MFSRHEVVFVTLWDLSSWWAHLPWSVQTGHWGLPRAEHLSLTDHGCVVFTFCGTTLWSFGQLQSQILLCGTGAKLFYTVQIQVLLGSSSILQSWEQQGKGMSCSVFLLSGDCRSWRAPSMGRRVQSSLWRDICVCVPLIPHPLD